MPDLDDALLLWEETMKKGDFYKMAVAIRHEMGLKEGIKYCKRKYEIGGPLKNDYLVAGSLLERWLYIEDMSKCCNDRIKGDLGTIPE